MSRRTGDYIALFNSAEEVLGTSVSYKTSDRIVEGYAELHAYVNLSAASGTDTIAFQLQDSANGTDFADNLDTNADIPATTTDGIYKLTTQCLGKYFRIKVTTAIVDSTGTFTYSIAVFLKS